MIQRVIYDVLTAAIAAVNSTPSILEDLFEDNWGLSRSEVDGIKNFFQQHTPNVIHGHARSDSEFPLYSIVLADEGETDSILGDSAGQVESLSDEDYGANCYSVIWTHNYDILCFAEHPDAVQYMYEVAKNAFFAVANEFIAAGLFELHLSGGDVAPDPRYIPEHLFIRRMRFSVQREFLRTDRNSKLAKAFKVAGIHVSRTGSTSDIGDVKDLITPYVEGA